MTTEEADRAIVLASGHLRYRFPCLAPALIEHTVSAVCAGFHDVVIHDFIPILVEREASEKLAHLAPCACGINARAQCEAQPA